MSFTEIEEMPLELLLDMEVVDSKVEAAFAQKHEKKSAERQLYGDDIF